MSDWIKREAERIRIREREQEQARADEAQDWGAIVARWPDFWRAVVQEIKSDVERFNAEFPDRPALLEVEELAGQLLVHSSGKQSISARADPNGIEYFVSPLNASRHRKGWFSFDVANGQVVARWAGTVGDYGPTSVSEHLLKDLLAS